MLLLILAVGSLIEDVVWMSYLQKGHKTLVKYAHSHRYLFDFAFHWVSFVGSNLT